MADVSVPPKRKRRWYQFSLRGLLLLMLVVGCGLGWLARERNVVRKRKAAVEAIETFGGAVYFDKNKPFCPAWLHPLLADDMAGEVTEVELGDSQVTDAGLVHLADLTNLDTLSLVRTQVSNAGLVHLAGLTKLDTLWLGGTQVTDAGLVYLAGLKKLTRLGLRNTRVTDAGVAELQKALPRLRILR